MHSEIDAERCKREIESCSDLVEEITGIRPTIFAPPSGDYNESCTRTAQSLGYRSVLWSIDTIDWRREGKAAILRRVFRDPKAGDFILMAPCQGHGGGPARDHQRPAGEGSYSLYHRRTAAPALLNIRTMQNPPAAFWPSGGFSTGPPS